MYSLVPDANFRVIDLNRSITEQTIQINNFQACQFQHVFQFWALETYNLLIHPKTKLKYKKTPNKDKNALDTDDGNSNLPKIGPTISRWRRDDAMLEEP